MGPEINLNGGIVANKGFIRQFASPGTVVISGTYVSAWGGIQSAGQTVGQVVWFQTLCLYQIIFTLLIRHTASSICYRSVRSQSRALHYLAYSCSGEYLPCFFLHDVRSRLMLGIGVECFY